MFNDCLIMAGGSGTRLWPASSSRMPKQFLPAGDKTSFFSLALDRALAAGGRVIIIAGKTHIPHVITDTAKLTAAMKKRVVVISEPAAKNTAAAIACAAVYSGNTERGAKDGNMLVLTSDHIIKPLKRFKADALLAEKAVFENKLVVFGIAPKHPETGYGYIETARQKRVSNPDAGNNSLNANTLFDVAAFHEKPDLPTAKKYIKSGRYFWNSGMFAFNIIFIIEQFYSLAPDVITPFLKLEAPKKRDYSIFKGISIIDNWKGLDYAYRKSKSISFDYAIAEKCAKTAMVRANFDWLDIGNWDEYIKLQGKICSQVFDARCFSCEGDSSCYVDSDIPVALAGAEDLIVVIRSGKDGSPASALITKKGRTQQVRHAVEMIKKAGRKDLL